MLSAPGSDLLPARERQLFVDQFEKDLKFFQLFFLLVNRSCPIKNIDLVWAEHESAGRVGLRHLGIAQALEGPCSRLLKCRNENPHPAFCNLINDYGRREAETCGVSDKSAEERVRQTGKPETYRCHFGLTDIAVPVIWNGIHVATLFSGQVLHEPATREGFDEIASRISGLPHIDTGKLEAAYWQMPVVTREDIENTATILGAFTEYLVNSWMRLAEAVKNQRHSERESQLARKEFAYLALGGTGDRAALREIMRKIGFNRPPNRILVVKPEAEEDYEAANVSFDIGLTTAVQAIEELCEKLDDVAAAYLRKSGICVFFDDQSRQNKDTGDINAQRLARRILHAIASRCDMRVRIGVGSAKANWRLLPDSYREARLALTGTTDAICTYRKPRPPVEELSHYAEEISAAIGERDFEAAKSCAVVLARSVQHRLAGDLTSQRVFFASALDSMFFAVQELGLDTSAVHDLRSAAIRDLSVPTDAIDLQEAYLRCVNSVLAESRLLYANRRTKTIERACRMIGRSLEQDSASQVTIKTVAGGLGISTSYLSRMFHQVMGETFEAYLIRKRIERARRLLLEPLAPISHVAEMCGFADANYFARVFRKRVGCSPREYRDNPLCVDAGAGLRPRGTSVLPDRAG